MLLGLFDLLKPVKAYFSKKPKCEKLIKYQNRLLEFSGLGIDLPGVKINLASFKTELKTIEQSVEVAKILDDFQYLVCTTLMPFSHTFGMQGILKIRITAISLLTALRSTLLAFENDPEKYTERLDQILAGIQSFPTSLEELTPLIQDKNQIESKIEHAIQVAGISSSDIEEIVKHEMEKYTTGLGEKQNIIIEKLEALQDNLDDDSDVRLVDVSINDGYLPVFDIKLRNTGNKVAFIKRVDIKVDKVWTLRDIVAYARIPIYDNYNTTLPVTNTPYTQSIDVSQSLDPNSVDRFTITVAYPKEGNKVFIYQLRFSIIYDEDNKQIDSNEILLMSSGLSFESSFNLSEEISVDEWVEQDIQAVLDVNNLDFQRNKRLQNLIEEFSNKGISEKYKAYKEHIIERSKLAPESEQIEIVVSCDKELYSTGDTVIVSGRVVASTLHLKSMTLTVSNPTNVTVVLQQIPILQDGSFIHQFKIQGRHSISGTYRGVVSYSEKYQIKRYESEFAFSFKRDEVKRNDGSAESKTYIIEVSGKKYPVRYRIDYGTLLNIQAIKELGTLSVTISSSSDGTLEIELPRNVIDAKQGEDGRSGADEDFVVFADEVPSDTADETEKTVDKRTLSIDFEQGTETIEIVGTYVG